jgi:phosphoadenosine phosphosulfate reductase
MGLTAIKETIVSMDLDRVNRELAGRSPQDVVCWALGLGMRPFMSTSFGPNSAALLHIVSEIDRSVPVVWVDTGYNLRDTYIVAEALMTTLPLNMQIYTPRMTAERWNKVYGGVPLDDPERMRSSPARSSSNPSSGHWPNCAWKGLSGIRRDTEFRSTLDIVSGMRGDCCGWHRFSTER